MPASVTGKEQAGTAMKNGSYILLIVAKIKINKKGILRAKKIISEMGLRKDKKSNRVFLVIF